jgi:amino acid transporter
MADETDVEKGGTLVRKLTLHDAVLFGIGAAIGSGILFAAAGGTEYAGGAVVYSWIVAAILIAIVTIPYAEISAMAPRSGISARISYYSYGNYGGFMGGWGLLVWTIMIPPIEAIAVSTYASYYLPALTYINSSGAIILSIYGILLSVALTIFFAVLNLIGVGRFGRFNTALTWLKIGAVVIFIIMVPLYIFHPGNFSLKAPFFISSSDFPGIFIAIPATGILFSFGGYRQVADMAGEIKNPKKNVPRAVILTLIIQSILYILMAIVIVGAVNFSLVPNSTGPGDWSAVANLGSPLADLMRETINKTIFGNPALVISGLVVLALLFAIYSPLGTFGTDLTGGARIFYGYSKEGSLPPVLGKTNKKGAPTYAIIAASVLAVIFVIPYPSWYTLVDFVVVAGAVNFAIVNASLPVLRKLYPKIERPFKVPSARLWSVIAFIASSLLIYWATYPVTIYALGVTLGGSLVFLYQVFTSKGQKIGLKHSIWIPFYIIGLIILSYIGGSQTGGTNLIPFPDDLYVVIIYAVIFWIISQVSAPKQPLRDLHEMIANAPVDPEKSVNP